MLYPQFNLFRQSNDLSGFWDFCFDREQVGETQGWPSGFSHGRPIAVPASWNDQFEDGRDYLGPAWYQIRFDLPWNWQDKRIFVRFGSVNYLATVWLNGTQIGGHEGGHLPFEFDITALVQPQANCLVVRVDGELAFDRVPPGNVTGDTVDFFPSHGGNTPQAQFDFFPFCGIQRPVLLYATPLQALQDITVVTDLVGSEGKLRVRAQKYDQTEASARFSLRGYGQDISVETQFNGDSAEALISVPEAALWSPAAPNLYELSVELLQNGAVQDVYSLPVGIRTVVVDGERLLLNGQPIYLTGFGRHEDFPVVGRGLLPPVIVKDYALMNWIGANSFRTSHYPYSEEMLALADRLGFLVIAETPAVGLYFREDGLERRLELCSQYVRELITRDKNHPSVIMWSVANEPHSKPPHAKPFFRQLYDEAHALDSTRPVTLVSTVGLAEESFEFCDVLCLNRYNGWYVQSGDIPKGLQVLSEDLDAIHEKYGSKPLILAEFGADAVSGMHAQPPEMFSEEYQAEIIARTIEVLRQKSYVVGEHVWNMCDFKTCQGVGRVGALNHKGVFTRDRRPKLAAHRLREIWGAK
ncbi:MAG: beta-glucuronidase [Chloroflexi bacterium HGW-Chloroflexi-6]|nr:MAG: beta-glucuronidase [Chloroflexi bacterium HGW-Chloroflexi-6]